MAEQLLALAELAVRTAERMGAESAEGYVRRSRTTEALLERGQVAAGELREDLRLIVRVQVGRGLGVGFATSTDPAAVRAGASQAVRSAASLPPVGPRWAGFPPRQRSRSARAPARRLRHLPTDLAIEGVSRMRDALGEHEDLRVLAGGVRETEFSIAVANSAGTSAIMTQSKTFAYVETVGRSGTTTTPACRAFAASSSVLPEVEQLAEEARADALEGARRIPVRSETAPVIFGPHALSFGDLGLVSYLLAGAVSAEHLLRGGSALRSAQGRMIASEAITVAEEGAALKWAGARPFDDEGIPTGHHPVIRSGRFRGFLFDFQTACELRRKSTGNGSRDSATGAISVRPHNLRLKPGRKPLADLIAGLRRGYLIKALQGTHSGSPHSGDFSAVCSQAYAIRDGEIAGGVAGLTLTSNLFSILRRVEAVAAEERDCDGTVVAPLLVRPLRFVAKR